MHDILSPALAPGLGAKSGASSRIHLASAVDRRYLLPLAVLLESIRRTQAPGEEMVLHLLHRSLLPEDLRRLGTLVNLNPIHVGAEHAQRCVLDATLPAEAAFPLLLAELIPREVEKVLFLDADLMALTDLRPLWELPLGDQVLLAAQDAAVPLCSSRRGVKRWRDLGIPKDTKYFNGGVMLIDLVQWRARSISRRVEAYLQRNLGQLEFVHQEVLNAILWDQRRIIDARWNLPGSLAGRSVAKSESARAQDPGIVHFAGRMKPWRFPVGGPFYPRYQQIMGAVTPLFPPTRASWGERMKSLYDRFGRGLLYPLERLLWQHRWL